MLFIKLYKMVLTLESTVELLKCEQYFPVVLFIMLYKVVLSCSTILVLFIMLYKVVLTFESVDEISKYNDSNESYTEQCFSVVLCITLYKVVLTFESADAILKCEQYFLVVLFINICLYRVVLTFDSVDETLKCDHFVLLSSTRPLLFKVVLTFVSAG